MNFDMDAVSSAMFWVGALFVFTPIVIVGIVIGTVWLQRRKRTALASAGGQSGPADDGGG